MAGVGVTALGSGPWTDDLGARPAGALLRWIAGSRVRHTCARGMACRDRGIRQLVEAGARDFRLRAATAVVALTGALAAATALAGPAAAAAPSLGAAPPPVQATDVAGDVGATAASAAAPRRRGRRRRRCRCAADRRPFARRRRAHPAAGNPGSRCGHACRRRGRAHRRGRSGSGRTPRATAGGGTAAGSPNAGGPPNAAVRAPARERSHARPGGQVRRHSQPAPSGTTEPPASGVDVPRAGLDVAAAGAAVTATSTTRPETILPSRPQNPPPLPGSLRARVRRPASSRVWRCWFSGSLLADPGVRRRLRLPAVAWRPPILVFQLDRPG